MDFTITDRKSIQVKRKSLIQERQKMEEQKMELLWEIIQFIFFSGLIVIISKNILVKTLRNLAENLNLKPKTVGDIAGIATSVPELLTISALMDY